MDEIDYKILEMLRQNSRENFVKIARKLGISEGTVRNRVAMMKKSGIIKAFTIKSKAGVEGVVLAKCYKKDLERILGEIEKISFDVFEVSGEYDIAVLLHENSIKELNAKIDIIRSIKGVNLTNTAIKLGSK